MATTPELHVHVTVNVNGQDLAEMKQDIAEMKQDIAEIKEITVSTKEELLAELADLKALVVETNDDITRVLAKLDAALAAGDLTEASAAVAELRGLVQAGDDALEAADPEVEVP